MHVFKMYVFHEKCPLCATFQVVVCLLKKNHSEDQKPRWADATAQWVLS
jgi:hypothetical protein